MAGIGFELKRLFSKKGLFALVRAYGYAGVVCAGPMILGMVLLFGVHTIAAFFGTAEQEQELLICMITYALLISLLLTNIISMVTTRYIADMLYMEKAEKVMPSFYGSTGLLLGAGGIIFGAFLLFCGVDPVYRIILFILFMELIVVWMQINYLTAVKNYKGILMAFVVAVFVAIAAGFFFVYLGAPVVTTLLLCVCAGYGVMMVWYYYLLLQYFPKGKGSSLSFLRWFDKYPELIGVGTSMGIGLFIHLIIMWFGPLGTQVEGLFYSAPSYDVPALFAFISILPTTINFITSVEVNFYPKYKIYFSLYNGDGSLVDIEQAKEELTSVLQKELSYTFTKQFFVSVVFVVAGTLLIPNLPFGFTEEMLGIYRVLCVGYAFYAVANCMMLISLYFADNKGAFLQSAVYAVAATVGTIVVMEWDKRYYGFGFLIAGVLFTAIALLRLWMYLQKLDYHVISSQPLQQIERKGIASRISEHFEKRLEK